MRRKKVGILGAIGVTLAASAGDVACAHHDAPASTPLHAVALVYPAGKEVAPYGISDWRLYLGRNQFVVTGYSEGGRPIRGYQLAAFKQSGSTPAHYRLTFLDGSGWVLRRYADGSWTSTGKASNEQSFVLWRSVFDMYQGAPQGELAVNAAGGSGIRTENAPLGGAGGPLHLETAGQAIGCLGGAAATALGAVATVGLGAGAIASCSTGLALPCYELIGKTLGAGYLTGKLYDGAASSCAAWCGDCLDKFGDPNAGPFPGSGSMYGGGASFPDPHIVTVQSEPLSRLGILDENSGGVCPLGGNDAGADDAGADAAGDDGGSDGGDDAGDDASGDDASGDDASGDDAGSGDDGGGTDDGGGSGDDGGAAGDDQGGDDAGSVTNPEDLAALDQGIDDMANNPTCASCPNQNDGSDLNVNPANGGVTINDPQGTPAAGPNPNGGDPEDPGAASPGPSGGAEGPVTYGDDNGGNGDDNGSGGAQDQGGTQDGTQDQGAQDQAGTEDQSTQDQAGTQDQATQDQASQDQAAQDQGNQASQDQASQDSQDQSSQDDDRHHESRGARTFVRRLLDWL